MNTDKTEYQQKAEELTKQLGSKVHAIVFAIPGSDDKIVGYVKEPDFITKLRWTDAYFAGSGYTMGNNLYDALLVKDQTDVRLYDTGNPDNQKYVMGGIKYLTDLVQIALPEIKKN